MPDSMCRLAVQHGAHTVDLSLPRDAPVGLLLPSVVDFFEPVVANEGTRWHLSRIGHGCLDERNSLRDNAVHDGDLLVLTATSIPGPVRIADEPWQALIDTGEVGSTPARAATAVACLAAAVLGGAALVWSGIATHAISHVVTAGAIAVGAVIAAIAVRRLRPDPVFAVTLSVIAVEFGAVAGYLAVPTRPSTANALLAAAVGCSTSILLLRIARSGATCLTALGTFGAVTSTALACGVVWSLPITATGAVLATLSLTALGGAAKLSVTAAGLAPPVPTLEPQEEDGDPAVVTARAIAAHRWLTGLVDGSAAAAAFGALLVALSGAPDFRPSAVAFAVVVGLVLVLRARTHVLTHRRAALIVSGATAVAAACAAVVIAAPQQAHWVGMFVTGVGVSALSGSFGTTGNPFTHQVIDVLEYLALATVIPLACWVAGLYGSLRGLGLP